MIDFKQHTGSLMFAEPVKEYPRGCRLPSMYGLATVYADLDFETFSTAGYSFDEETKKWKSIVKSPPHGLGAVGASVYTEHPSAEILSLAYNLKDGRGPRLWLPGMPAPTDLFEHIAKGIELEAWNSLFEFYTWQNICVVKLGWPPLPLGQLRDAMAKARAFSLPGALGNAAAVVAPEFGKNKDGTRLLNKFSKGRNPTKKDSRRRIFLHEDPEDAQKLYNYNLQDIVAESAVSSKVPDLIPQEMDLWLLDQRINTGGVNIDEEGLNNCLEIVRQAFEKYEAELVGLTGGAVKSAGEIKKLTEWLARQGMVMPNMQAETVETVLETPADAGGEALALYACPPESWPLVRRILEIRSVLGAASVKKLFAISRRRSKDGKLRDLFAYCGADRTGRFAGRGPQPQNLPNSGPKVRQCEPINGCAEFYTPGHKECPHCGLDAAYSVAGGWGIEAVESALRVIASRDLAHVEKCLGDPIAAVSGCLRGLFCADEGYDFICSDYSAIEAVVLAMLAGEEWRIEVFRTHGKIYEMAVSDISGIPFEEVLEHKRVTGDHHPLRKKVGKVAELASGYCGWIGAWKNFGADDHFKTDNEIRDAILKWRDASPMICELWGGQVRKHPDRWEWTHDLHGLEGAVVQAIQDPGVDYVYRDLRYRMQGDILFCYLPSGRRLTYHSPRLYPTTCSRSKLQVFSISYMGWNTDYKKGPTGWLRLDTYGGKLTENVTQAVARDILAHAMINIEKAGYTIPLHVHDEVIAQILAGSGSVEEIERIMAKMPKWAEHYPISAADGWRGKRYRKD